MVPNAQDQLADVPPLVFPAPMRAGGASSHRVNAGGSLRHSRDELLISCTEMSQSFCLS